MDRCIALILAAGRGYRFGTKIPKQYFNFNGQLILRRTLATFISHVGIDAVRVVIHPDDWTLYETAVLDLRVLEPIVGGPTRQDSVRLGLESLVGCDCSKVLIHDGVRPFVSAGTITRVIEALSENVGAIAAVPVNDTIKRVNLESVILETIDRSGLWYAQTPQGFLFHDILNAHRAAIGYELTDDAAVAERAGLPVRAVFGQLDNVKITDPSDLERVTQNVKIQDEVRVGSGLDIHAFGPGDGIWLCGIKIPYNYTLVGHSDADVALHALTDALLGAVASGDIGRYFPQAEPQWANVSSEVFVRYAVNIVRALGGEIIAVDITILCEQPKVGPYRLAMVSRLASILRVAQSRINVKGKTAEGLGFTGRCEGIAVYATATVKLKCISSPYDTAIG